jgi:hypothetical protein
MLCFQVSAMAVLRAHAHHIDIHLHTRHTFYARGGECGGAGVGDCGGAGVGPTHVAHAHAPAGVRHVSRHFDEPAGGKGLNVITVP